MSQDAGVVVGGVPARQEEEQGERESRASRLPPRAGRRKWTMG